MRMPNHEVRELHAYKELKKLSPIPRFENAQKANKIVKDMIESLRAVPHHEFNCTLPEDGLSCNRSLIIHRATTKFSEPSKSENLREKAFETYIDYERDLTESYLKQLGSDFLSRPGMLNTSRLLTSWLRNFDIWKCLRTSHIRFSPGETFISAKGETSIVAKLCLKTHWTVSEENIDYACYLIYHCRGLKLAAKAFIPELSRRERARLYAKHSQSKSVHGTGYLVFRELLLKYVLLITDGARGSSVPKNDKTDRFINVEPFFNVLIQACIELYIRKVLRIRGNDLGIDMPEFVWKNGQWSKSSLHISSAQHLHGVMIKDDHLCTIDLKNASDSTLMWVLYKLVPRFASIIDATRSRVISLDETRIEPMKVSSMGNGYTFGLMTLILYAAGVANSISIRVYGDDIIIPNVDALDYIQILESLEYTVNYEKSFIYHPFRESCGYFYHRDLGYLTSFDIHFIEDVSDFIVTTNKLYVLHECCVKFGDVELQEIFLKAWKGLLALSPTLQKGPTPPSMYVAYQNLGLYVFDPDYMYKHKRAAVSKKLRKKLLDLMSLTDCHLHIPSNDDLTVVGVVKFRNDRSKYSATGKLHELLQLTNSHHGKIRDEGRWTSELCLVNSTGCVFRIDQLLRLNDEEITFKTRKDNERRPHMKAPLASL